MGQLRTDHVLRRPGLHGPRRSLGVESAYDLSGAAVCVTSGTTTELNMADFFRQNAMEYNPQVFEDTDVVL